MEDNGISKVVNLPIEDTGVQGHIQVCTQGESNYHVRYMPNLLVYDRYMLVSLIDYSITFDNTDTSDNIKQQVIEFVVQNTKWVLKYWYCGSSMKCTDILELFDQIIPV